MIDKQSLYSVLQNDEAASDSLQDRKGLWKKQ